MAKSVDKAYEVKAVLTRAKELLHNSKNQEVLDLLTPLIRIEESPEILFSINNLISKAYQAQGQYKKAMEAVDDAIKYLSSVEYPSGASAASASSESNNTLLSSLHATKGLLLYYFAKYDEAIAEANTAITLDNQLLKAYTVKSSAYKHLKNVDEASSALQKAVDTLKSQTSHGVRDIELDSIKSVLARQCHEFELAKKYAQYVIENAPVLSDGYTLIGIANLMSAISKLEDDDFNLTEDNLELIEALKNLDSAISINPQDPQNYFNKGLALEVIGKLEEADEMYIKSLEVSPENLPSVLAHVNILVSKGNYEMAFETIDNIIELNPGCESAIHCKSKILAALDRYSEAEECLEQLVLMNPSNSEYLYRKGLLEATQDKYDEALVSFSKALEIKPDDSESQYNLALTHASLGNYSEAIKQINLLLEIDPSYAKVHQARGYVLSEIAGDKTGEGFQYFYQVMLSKEFKESHSDITSMLESGDIENAMTWYYNNISQGNSACLELEEEAQSKIDLNQLDSAEMLLRDAIKINPKFTLAKYSLSEILRSKGLMEDAEAILLSLDKDEEAYLDALKGNKYPHISRIEKDSLSSFEFAISCEPDNPMFHSSIAGALGKFNMLDAMMHHTEEASKLLKSSSIYLDHAQREFIKEQNELRIELYKLVNELVDEAKKLQSSIESGLSTEARIDTLQAAEMASVGLHASMPAGIKFHVLEESHVPNISILREGSLKALSACIKSGLGMPSSTSSDSISVRALSALDHEDDLDVTSAGAVAAAAAHHNSGMNFMTMSLERASKAQGHLLQSGSNGSSLKSDIPDEASVSALDHEISHGGMKALVKATMALKASVRKASERTTLKDMKDMIENLKSIVLETREENTRLNQKVEELEGGLGYALRHDAELSEFESAKKEIEESLELREYYSGFVGTIQKMYIGFLSRASGEVAATEFSVPGLSMIPFPPIISQVVEAVKTSIAVGLEIKEDNEITRALRSSPDHMEFISEIIPRVAAKIALGSKKESIIHHHDKEYSGIFKIAEVAEFFKNMVFENPEVTPYAELGAEDAMKILTGMRLGNIRIVKLTNLEEIANEIVAQITSEAYGTPVDIAKIMLHHPVLHIDPRLTDYEYPLESTRSAATAVRPDATDDSVALESTRSSISTAAGVLHERYTVKNFDIIEEEIIPTQTSKWWAPWTWSCCTPDMDNVTRDTSTSIGSIDDIVGEATAI